MQSKVCTRRGLNCGQYNWNEYDWVSLRQLRIGRHQQGERAISIQRIRESGRERDYENCVQAAEKRSGCGWNRPFSYVQAAESKIKEIWCICVRWMWKTRQAQVENRMQTVVSIQKERKILNQVCIWVAVVNAWKTRKANWRCWGGRSQNSRQTKRTKMMTELPFLLFVVTRFGINSKINWCMCWAEVQWSLVWNDCSNKNEQKRISRFFEHAFWVIRKTRKQCA